MKGHSPHKEASWLYWLSWLNAFQWDFSMAGPKFKNVQSEPRNLWNCSCLAPAKQQVGRKPTWRSALAHPLGWRACWPGHLSWFSWGFGIVHESSRKSSEGFFRGWACNKTVQKGWTLYMVPNMIGIVLCSKYSYIRSIFYSILFYTPPYTYT